MRKTLIIMANAMKQGRMLPIISLIGGFMLCLLFFLFTQIFSGSNDVSKISIGLIDCDKSAVSADFERYLKDDLSMGIVNGDDVDKMKTELVEKHISAVIIVPEDFQESLFTGDIKAIETILAGDYENEAYMRAYLESYTASLAVMRDYTVLASEQQNVNGEEAMLEQIMKTARETRPTISEDKASGVSGEKNNENDLYRVIVGFYTMFAFLLAMFLSSDLLRGRKEGRYDRLRLTGVKAPQYLGGMCLYTFISALLLILPFIIYMGVRGVGALDSGKALLMMILFALFVIAFALFCGIAVNSTSAMTACMIGGATILSLVGGAWFPLDLSPPVMRAIARITPEFWFMDAFDTASGTGTGVNYWICASMVLLFALLFFVLAGFKFARRSRGGA